MTDDERAQAFVDQGDYNTGLDLSPWPSITTLPLRIPNRITNVRCDDCRHLTSLDGLPERVECVEFTGCTSLTSVAGLPESVTYAYFTGCTSLTSVAGLPESVTYACFIGCTSLTGVTGLSQRVEYAYFGGCTALVSVAGLPESIKEACFAGCTHLQRITHGDVRYYFDPMFDPARDVHTLMVSGMSDKLLSNQVGIGPDIALLIGRFVTSGLSPVDRMETLSQVRARYSI